MGKQKGEEAGFLGEGKFWAWQNLRCQWDIQVEVSRRQLSLPDWSLQDRSKLEVERWQSVVPYRWLPPQWIDLVSCPREYVWNKERRELRTDR